MTTTQPRELSWIDSGLKDMANLPLSSNVEVLNLHYNQIAKIENLDQLNNLKHLDLSSNCISVISGLESLLNLKSINLSCNVITKVEGLHNLRSVVKVNLSYNNIFNLGGFQSMFGPRYLLECIDLQGNQITSAEHVKSCLKGCSNLKYLTLAEEFADNPVCQSLNYRSQLLMDLPQLQLLDGVDRRGQVVSTDNVFSDIPGIEEYVKLLEMNDTEESTDATVGAPVDVSALKTPAIDTMMRAYWQRGNHNQADTSSVNSETLKDETQPNTSVTDTSHSERLQRLEAQIEQLVTQNQRNDPRKNLGNTNSHDWYVTDSDKDSASPPRSNSRIPRSALTSRRGKQRGSTVMRTIANDLTSASDLTLEGHSVTSTPRSARRDAAHSSSLKAKQGDKLQDRKTKGARKIISKVQSTSADERMKEDVKATYVEIMEELESERERRWKAELACQKLSEGLHELELKGYEGEELKRRTSEAASRLRDAVHIEHEARLAMEKEVQSLKDRVSTQQSELDACRTEIDNKNMAIQQLKDKLIKEFTDYERRQSLEVKKLQDYSLKCTALQRELQIVRQHNDTLSKEIIEMKGLLVLREQEHRKEIQNKYTLDSPQLQDMISREVAKADRVHQQEVSLLKDKCADWQKKYEDLEDEFRMALYTESQRYTDVLNKFEETKNSNDELQQAVTTLKRRDNTSLLTIQELTSLAKEQKGRLEELSQAKQDQWKQYRERIASLEIQLEQARTKVQQLDGIKKERNKLQSQVEALQSLAEGLRAEKKLWAEELAQQGSSLAQDRGRLQAKIDGLQSDVNTIRMQLDKETDAVRIKSKMIENQTETIQKLKEGIQERDEEIKKLRDEVVKAQDQADERVSAELTANQELLEKLERARERKEQLKNEVALMECRVEESQEKYRELSQKWDKKSVAISELEQQVRQMKNNWELKEKKLTDERVRAVEAARIAVEKLRTMDNSFREQLDTKESSHQKAQRALQLERDEVVDLANKRVLEVEEEMRLLLTETEIQKRTMEERIKKLSTVLGELQQGIL